MTCGNQRVSSTECTVGRDRFSLWCLLRKEKWTFDRPLQGLVGWARYLARIFAAVLVILGPAVAQEELTAEVVQVPDAHDATSTFKIRIQFSTPIETGYKTLRDHSFTVSGGRVTNASRVEKRSDLWNIEIKPTAHEAVTVTLEGRVPCDLRRAVCTSDGQMLSATLSHTVLGPSGKSVAAATGAPTVSRLESSYPNPFNSTTQIAYGLATTGPVRLTIYSALGQLVRTLVDQVQAAGFYQVHWDGRDLRGAELSTGVYMARLYYPGGVQIRRLFYLK